MRTHHVRLFLALTLLLLGSVPLLAATQNATVYGTVYDDAGNPESGVTVNFANPDIGFKRSATTGSDGSYSFAEVPPAPGYVLTAVRGTRIWDVRAGIVINVGDERVIFPPLREIVATAGPAPVKQQEAAAVSTETVATSVSGVITGEQLRSLPLYNRNFLTLGGLTPNVHDLDGANELAGASFSVAGSRGTSNDFLLDGVDNVASSTNQAVPFQVNDAIQEFRVTSAGAAAEYGRNRGGVVNVVTRRAGNAFHGSAFGYFGSDSLNADSPLSVYNGSGFDRAAAYAGSAPSAGYFNPFPLTYNQYVASAATAGYCTDAGAVSCNTFFNPTTVLADHNRFKAPFDSKQFGANGGGALVKNKLFLFASYEGTRIDNPNPVFERVPSSFDKTYAPNGVTPFYSSTNPDFTGAQDILNLFPAANVVAIPGVLEFYQGTAPNYTNVSNFLLRSDWVPSEGNSFTFRYVAQVLNQLHDATLPPSSAYPGNGAMRHAFNQNFSGAYTHSFSSNVLNEFRAGFNRFNVRETAQDARFDATSIFGYHDLPTFMLNGIDAQYSGANALTDPGAYSGWTNFILGFSPMAPTLDGRFPFARIGAPLSAPTSRVDTTVFFGDSVTWSRGRHTLKFGGEVDRLTNDYYDGAVSRGWVYSGNIGEFTSDSATFWLDSYMFPSFDWAQRQHDPYVASLTSWRGAAYIQDTWRVHPRVTVNFGLRFETDGAPTEAGNRLWNYDPAANGLVRSGSQQVVDFYDVPCTTSTPYYGLTAYWTANLNWSCSSTGRSGLGDRQYGVAPRVGLAWDLFGDAKSVLRFGFGIYHDQVPIDQYAKLTYNRPVSPTQWNGLFGQSIDFSGGFCLFLQCGAGNRVLDFGTWANNPIYAPFVQASFPLGVYHRDLGHQALPRTYQFNATWQQQLTNKLTMELGYVGALGRDLPVVYNSNFASEFGPTTGSDIFDFFPVWTLTDRGESNYHSLMARLRAAEFHGLRLDVAYHWSKSLDNASSVFFPTTAMSFNNVVYASYFARLDLSAYCLYFPATGSCGAVAGAPIVVPSIDLTPGAVTTTGQGLPQVSRYLIAQDPVNFLRDDYGPSDFDSRHRIVLNYTWQLPFRSESAWLKHWEISGVLVGQAGQPFTIFSGPIAGEITQRADLLGPVAVDPTNSQSAISTTNLATAFPVCRAATTWPNTPFLPDGSHVCVGNSGRNAFRGGKFVTMNFAIQKGFNIGGEGRMLTFRTEFYNLFNRSNFYNPISLLSVDGTTLNPDFGKIKSAHDPRQIQFAVRFSW